MRPMPVPASVPSAGRRAADRLGARPAAALSVLVGVLLGAALAAGPVLAALTSAPWERLVDLDVYRAAGESVLTGREVYDYRTELPHLLPFTYPPVAALAAVPLALVPVTALQWGWTLMQVVLLAWVVHVAFAAWLDRLGAARWAAQGLLTGAACWLVPVRDSLWFGQVDVIVVALCLADLAGRAGRLPRGTLVGLATALKLTPGVFAVHYWLAGRRRAAWTAAGVVLAATALAALALPGDSAAYWFGALVDPDRLGQNAGTSNQSLRGVLLRLGPDGTAGTLLWVVLCVPVAAVGFWGAARASRSGDVVRAVALVGLLAVLLSPVAWIHHLAWVVVVVAALVGDGRVWWRWALAGVVAAFYSLPVPWWGVAALWAGEPVWWARLQQQGFFLGALALVVLLAFLPSRVEQSRGGAPERAAPAPGVTGTGRPRAR